MRPWNIALGLLPLLTVLGCGPYEVPITRTYTFSVNAAEGPLCQQAAGQLLDLSNDKDFQDNKNRISRIEITELRVTITDPQTQADSVATQASGTVIVAASQSGAGAVTLGTYQPVNLTQGATRLIKVDQAGADTLVKLIQTEPYQAWVWAEGCVDQLPAHFQFQVQVSFSVFVRLI